MPFMRYLKHKYRNYLKTKKGKFIWENIVKNKAYLAMLIADKIEFQAKLIKDK